MTRLAHQHIDFQRRLKFVALLNAEHGWGLTPEIQQHYAQQVATYCPNIADFNDARLRATLRYYHQDHALVEALRNPDHPDHGERWMEWTRQTLRLLASKCRGALYSDEADTSLEDLAQEAIFDLWRGLRTFSYQSSFYTWAFTVISHCLARDHRALQTKKRATPQTTQSLDSVLVAETVVQDGIMASPEEVALGNRLTALVLRTLEEQLDQRLVIVFQLWAYEEQTLRAIGNQLHLSPGRVHALLKQAIKLLRNEQTILDWIQHDPVRLLAK